MALNAKEKQDLRDRIITKLNSLYQHPLFETILKDKRKLLEDITKDLIILAQE